MHRHPGQGHGTRDRQTAFSASQPSESVHPGHVEVQDDASQTARIEGVEHLFRRGVGLNPEPFGLEDQPERFPHGSLIIHHGYCVPSIHLPRRTCEPPIGAVELMGARRRSRLEQFAHVRDQLVDIDRLL